MENLKLKALLDQLLTEREAIDNAIASLEKLAAVRGGGKRRGRPPKWLSQAREVARYRK